MAEIIFHIPRIFNILTLLFLCLSLFLTRGLLLSLKGQSKGIKALLALFFCLLTTGLVAFGFWFNMFLQHTFR